MQEHLAHVIRFVDLRGSDVRLSDGSTLNPTGDYVPYPSFIWKWVPTMSFPFQYEEHINILELKAVILYFERVCSLSCNFHSRFLHLLDSRVACAVLAKGRSSSGQLNKLLRRLASTMIASDCTLYPLWASSNWQPADRGSRVWSND